MTRGFCKICLSKILEKPVIVGFIFFKEGKVFDNLTRIIQRIE